MRCNIDKKKIIVNIIHHLRQQQEKTKELGDHRCINQINGNSKTLFDQTTKSYLKFIIVHHRNRFYRQTVVFPVTHHTF